jgi:uncharacterized protein
MKESMFNVYLLDEKERKYLVYNTLYGSIVQIDDEVYTLIKNNTVDEIDHDLLEVLAHEKFVIDDNLDELDVYRLILNRDKYNADSIGFTVIPTHACNLACKYCYQGHGDVLSTTMSEETVRRTIEFIKKNAEGRRKIDLTFYGGESLLFPDKLFRVLKEIHTFAQQQGADFHVLIVTNGTLVTEDIIKKLNPYNHEVQITLSGPRDVHNAIRVDKQGHGTYDTLMDVMALLKTHNIVFRLRIDVSQNSYDAIDTVLEDLAERGFQGIRISFGRISQDCCYTEPELDMAEVNPNDLVRLCKLAYDKGFETAPLKIYNYIICPAIADNYVIISPKGDVYKCNAACNFPEHRVGFVDEHGDLADMNHEVYCAWTLRDPLLISECRECKFSPICGGGCAMAAYIKTGDLYSPNCKGKNMGEVVRTYIMVEYPQLFETCRFETIIA